MTISLVFLRIVSCVNTDVLSLIRSTYKYCQISEAGVSSLEFGPNREVDVDLSSPKPARYILLSDGSLRVMYAFIMSNPPRMC
jgi:hypothetical protein